MRLALRKVSIPRIFHVPGPLHLEHRLFRNIEMRLATKDDYWLASCLWTRSKYLSCGVEESHVGLAYYGVNEEDFLFAKDKSLSSHALQPTWKQDPIWKQVFRTWNLDDDKR